MTIFLAAIPIVHVQSMFKDMEDNNQRFAFASGAGALELFHKISENCENENIQAYIYISKSGADQLGVNVDKQLGVFLQGRLCGWIRADSRGQYPKSGLAHRPASTVTDDRLTALFWEIDNIRRLPERLPLSEFIAANSKPFSDDFVPQGPMLVNRKSI